MSDEPEAAADDRSRSAAGLNAWGVPDVLDWAIYQPDEPEQRAVPAEAAAWPPEPPSLPVLPVLPRSHPAPESKFADGPPVVPSAPIVVASPAPTVADSPQVIPRSPLDAASSARPTLIDPPPVAPQAAIAACPSASTLADGEPVVRQTPIVVATPGPSVTEWPVTSGSAPQLPGVDRSPNPQPFLPDHSPEVRPAPAADERLAAEQHAADLRVAEARARHDFDPNLVPVLPDAVRPTIQSTAPMAFDARAMVESQRHADINPVYGALPEGTEAGREAAALRRAQANRKRARNRVLGWLAAMVLFGAVVVACVLAYVTFRTEERDPSPVDDSVAVTSSAPAGGTDDASATPLGELEQQIEAQDAVDSAVTPSAGGLLSAVDDARAAVEDAGQEPTETLESATLLTEADVMPVELQAVTRRLADRDGAAIYTVEVSMAPPEAKAAVDAWVAKLSDRPQAPADDPALALVDAPLVGTVTVSIRTVDGRLVQLIVVGRDPAIAIVQNS